MSRLNGSLVGAARRLITSRGLPAQLAGAHVLDAQTGESSAPDAVSTTATFPGVTHAYSTADGALIVGRLVSYCLPDVEPQIGGTLSLDGKTWRIISVRQLNHGTGAACYRMEVES